MLGEAIYGERSRDQRDRAELRENNERQSYLESFQLRFTDELPSLSRGSSDHGWQTVVCARGTSAWLDIANRQIRSDWLPLADTPSLPSLELAKDRCRKYPPVGYWSLATEAENALMWKTGGYIKRDVPIEDWNRYQFSKPS